MNKRSRQRVKGLGGGIYDESKHPRAMGGKFASKGGTTASVDETQLGQQRAKVAAIQIEGTPTRAKLQAAAAEALLPKLGENEMNPNLLTARENVSNFRLKEALKRGQFVRHPNGNTYYKDKSSKLHAKSGHQDGDLHPLEDEPYGKYALRQNKIVER